MIPTAQQIGAAYPIGSVFLSAIGEQLVVRGYRWSKHRREFMIRAVFPNGRSCCIFAFNGHKRPDGEVIEVPDCTSDRKPTETTGDEAVLDRHDGGKNAVDRDNSTGTNAAAFVKIEKSNAYGDSPTSQPVNNLGANQVASPEGPDCILDRKEVRPLPASPRPATGGES